MDDRDKLIKELEKQVNQYAATIAELRKDLEQAKKDRNYYYMHGGARP